MDIGTEEAMTVIVFGASDEPLKSSDFASGDAYQRYKWQRAYAEEKIACCENVIRDLNKDVAKLKKSTVFDIVVRWLYFALALWHLVGLLIK